ncbi:MAG: hypothetical protein ACR2P8_01955 [Myxococcota bacterium]
MTLVGRIRATRYKDGTARQAQLLEEDRAAFQLARLNEVWSRAVAESSYWARIAREHGTPEHFGSLEEFASRVPVLTRDDLQRHAAELMSTARPPDLVRMTGGSTSKPVQLPTWSSELEVTRYDQWIGRGTYGVTPASRLFLLWGHSHLLGTGWRGWLRARRLEASDRLLGYLRFSAYDLSPETMRRAGEALARFRPDYVLGYGVALDLLARANEDRGELFAGLGIKAVIGTAESFPHADTVDRLGGLFGAPVAMEYGAVETNIMAHTRPEGGFRVFWYNQLIEGLGEGHLRRVAVTSLYPRALPLFRYEIGDEIEFDRDPGSAVGVDSFAAVAGRCNDYVTTSDGAVVHSELFSHAVRPCAGIRGFQIVAGDDLMLRYTSPQALDDGETEAIRERLGRIHEELRAIRFERVERLEQTVAGKTRMIVQA